MLRKMHRVVQRVKRNIGEIHQGRNNIELDDGYIVTYKLLIG